MSFLDNLIKNAAASPEAALKVAEASEAGAALPTVRDVQTNLAPDPNAAPVGGLPAQHENDPFAGREEAAPEGYGEVETHEDTFGDVDGDLDDDLNAPADDMTGMPGYTAEPEPAPEPTPPQPVQPAWMTDDHETSTGTDYEPSGAAMYKGNDPDEDEDDDYDGPSVKDKTAGLLKPITGIFEKNPALKRPIMFGAGGVAAALVAALVFGGGDPGSHTQTPPPVAAVDQSDVDEPASTEETTLLPAKVSAPCPAGSSSPILAFSNKSDEAWVCKRVMGADGAVLYIGFKGTVVVNSITLMPGWNYVAPNGTDHWGQHHLITQVLWSIGGQRFVQKINPTRAGATLQLPGNGIATQAISMVIQKTVEPSATSVENGDDGGVLSPLGGGAPGKDVDDSTAISSIVITGREMQ